MPENQLRFITPRGAIGWEISSAQRMCGADKANAARLLADGPKKCRGVMSSSCGDIVWDLEQQKDANRRAHKRQPYPLGKGSFSPYLRREDHGRNCGRVLGWQNRRGAHGKQNSERLGADCAVGEYDARFLGAARCCGPIGVCRYGRVDPDENRKFPLAGPFTLGGLSGM